MLRRHTHDAHEALHTHASFAALLRHELDLDGYRKLMRALHGFYAPLDRQIARVLAERPALGVAYSYARRSEILARDLQDLGFSAEEIDHNDRCEQAAQLVSAASLGGVLYVIEGAMLGGATIDRAVKPLLSAKSTDGRGYWAWCRSENGHRWRMTLEFLERLCADGTSLDDLCLGAESTFLALSEWLAPLERTPLAVERGAA